MQCNPLSVADPSPPTLDRSPHNPHLTSHERINSSTRRHEPPFVSAEPPSRKRTPGRESGIAYPYLRERANERRASGASHHRGTNRAKAKKRRGKGRASTGWTSWRTRCDSRLRSFRLSWLDGSYIRLYRSSVAYSVSMACVTYDRTRMPIIITYYLLYDLRMYGSCWRYAAQHLGATQFHLPVFSFL